MSNNPSFYPFGPSPTNSGQAYLGYDLEIQKIDPGIILNPTEPNGVYVVFREVNGCSWWVLNADYNIDDAQWEQDSPTNAANPAYAIEQCADGTRNIFMANPTIIPGNPVSWVTLWSTDTNGNQTFSPLTATLTTQIFQTISGVWNAGTGVVMHAKELVIVDTSSSAASYVDEVYVNGTPVWQIRKDGTLETGIIPYARITGAPSPPSFNNPTFTGTSTFDGPAVFTDGVSVTGGTLDSSVPVDFTDGLSVTGGETVDTLDVTGSATIHDPTFTGAVVLPTGAAVTSLTGSNGIVVTNTGNAFNASGGSLVNTIESTDSSVTIAQTGQVVNITAGSSAPAIPGSWFINTEFLAPGTGSTGGSTSLGPLPGNSSVTYRIVYWGTAALKDSSSSISITGTPATGVTWDEATATYYNGLANAFPFMYFGTAEGGTTPTVTWACASGEYIFQTPFFATLAAGIQL